MRFVYFAVTERVAEPPRLLLTVTFPGFADTENWLSYLPPPVLVSVPMSAPDEVAYVLRTAPALVLVAWTCNICLEPSYSASVTFTVSAGGGGELPTVSDAVCVAPPAVAEMVTEVDELGAVVETVNVALVLPAGTVTPDDTVATAVLPLLSVTNSPPEGAAALSVTVPLLDVPP